jgi:flavin reductase (DIM6/NTAB) family NADH-FMN oxidoreductase RutF
LVHLRWRGFFYNDYKDHLPAPSAFRGAEEGKALPDYAKRHALVDPSTSLPVAEEHGFDHFAYRQALGQFATGVTVITTRGEDGAPAGLTANSFNSVSLEPPLVLWSLSRSALSRAAFEASDCYAVNVLAADQVAVAKHFSRSAVDKFDGVDWYEGLHGLPLIPGAMALFQCRTQVRHEGGDHIVYLGEVMHFSRSGRPPLIFHGGHYCTTAHLNQDPVTGD